MILRGISAAPGAATSPGIRIIVTPDGITTPGAPISTASCGGTGTVRTVDRSTLFRTLTILNDAHLLHNVDDGSGVQKYCVCHHDDTRHCMGHVHLTCRICHNTYCLTNTSIPQVPLPEGFHVEETEYIVKGICSRCAQKAAKQ